MQQLREPNLSVKGQAGWCLSVAQDVWGVPHIYPKAIDAWNASSVYNHPNEQPPNAKVVVYWTYVESGIQYGHIATWIPGQGVYSSPFDVSYGSQWFAGIDEVTARIRRLDRNCVYLGWSEALSGVRLVSNTVTNTGGSTVDTIKSMYWRLMGRQADDGGIAHYTEQVRLNGWEFVYNDLKNSNEGQADWERRNPSRVDVLEDGMRQRDAKIAELTVALANEQGKPPREVVKEVIKIVEKPVETPIYLHDEETKQNVNKILGMTTSIFNYFAGQYKTFSKYIKKG